jgi:hypothetical protein
VFDFFAEGLLDSFELLTLGLPFGSELGDFVGELLFFFDFGFGEGVFEDLKFVLEFDKLFVLFFGDFL